MIPHEEIYFYFTVELVTEFIHSWGILVKHVSEVVLSVKCDTDFSESFNVCMVVDE